MSTRITTIYDGIVTHLNTVFPSSDGYFRMRNPYRPENNPDSMLIKAWGFSLGGGQNDEKFTGCEMGIDRELTVTLVRQWIALESDVTRRADIEKLILEDQFKLFQSLEADNTIGQVASDVKFISDNGIEFLEAETNKFLMINSLLRLKYVEKLTP